VTIALRSELGRLFGILLFRMVMMHLPAQAAYFCCDESMRLQVARREEWCKRENGGGVGMRGGLARIPAEFRCFQTASRPPSGGVGSDRKMKGVWKREVRMESAGYTIRNAECAQNAWPSWPSWTPCTNRREICRFSRGPTRGPVAMLVGEVLCANCRAALLSCRDVWRWLCKSAKIQALMLTPDNGESVLHLPRALPFSCFFDFDLLRNSVAPWLTLTVIAVMDR
jgi:hypothetical protein